MSVFYPYPKSYWQGRDCNFVKLLVFDQLAHEYTSHHNDAS